MVQRGPGSHPASYSMNLGDYFPGISAASAYVYEKTHALPPLRLKTETSIYHPSNVRLCCAQRDCNLL